MIIEVFIGILILCVTLLIRNEMVYKFLGKLLEEEGEWWERQISSGVSYVELRRTKSLNQTKMCLLFWKPLKSFVKPTLEDYYTDIIK